MGHVYRARDTRLGREVALKILPSEFSTDPQRLHYFEQEARTASALNHSNIVTIYDIGEIDSTRYIAMELVDGQTLRELLGQGPVPARTALHLAAQIADGLATAHSAGIVHRDLKPENVMVTKDSRAKILDFGLAKLAHPPSGIAGADPQTALTQTQPGTVLGTVGYMSPEQARGESADFRSDQFSLGALFYEMVTGRRAFQRETAVETLSAIVRDEPQPIGGIRPDVAAPIRWVIERCLAKPPDERYFSTRDLARELQGLREHMSEIHVSGSIGAAVPAARPRRSVRRLVTVGVLGALAIAGALSTFFIGRSLRELPPTFEQLTFRHGNLTGARLTADGQTVVYGGTWVGRPTELYTTRTENPQSGSLGLTGAGILSISSAGELAVVLGCRLNWGECFGTLARVPLTGGAPREILEDVMTADWAPDAKTLAAVQFSGGAYQLQYPIGTTLYEAAGWMTFARVSPDGELVAFLEHPILGDLSGSVSLVDRAGNKRELSSGWKALRGLAWSADGGELWFTGSRVGKGGSLGLHAVTLNGAERAVLSAAGTLKLLDISRDGRRVLLMRGTQRGGIVSFGPDDSNERDLSWFDYSTVADLSPDGRTLLFYEWGEGVGGTLTVFLRKTDGSDAVRLGEGRPLSLSPDGRWAVAVQETSPPQLLVLPTGAGEARTLPRGVVTDYIDWAAWSPDGRRIFFAGQDSDQRKRTYVQDIEGGDPRPVTPDGMVGVLLSPDARRIVTADRYGEYYVCPIDEGEPVPIEGYLDGDVLLQWGADGRALFVREAGNLELKIYKLDLATGSRELWKELSPPDRAALIDIGSNPGEVRLTPDGRSYAYTYWTFPGELYLVEGLR
jgi:Tol biopolymer transport system component